MVVRRTQAFPPEHAPQRNHVTVSVRTAKRTRTDVSVQFSRSRCRLAAGTRILPAPPFEVKKEAPAGSLLLASLFAPQPGPEGLEGRVSRAGLERTAWQLGQGGGIYIRIGGSSREKEHRGSRIFERFG
jgi:hypothetical protein